MSDGDSGGGRGSGKDYIPALASVAQFVGVSFHRLKVHGFNSHELSIPRFNTQVAGLIPGWGIYKEAIDVSLTWMDLSLSLSPTPLLSESNEKIMSSGEDLEKGYIPITHGRFRTTCSFHIYQPPISCLG